MGPDRIVIDIDLWKVIEIDQAGPPGVPSITITVPFGPGPDRHRYRLGRASKGAIDNDHTTF